MEARMNIKNILITMAIICIASMFFINVCLAENTGKVITETARIREQPKTDSKVLDLISSGEEVEIIEDIDGWYKVNYKKLTGYIRKDLVEVKNKTENKSNNTTIQNEESKNEITENTTIEENSVENVNTETTTELENNTISNETKLEETSITVNSKYVLTENIKLKKIPLISSIEINEINKDTEVEAIEILNDWVKIKTPDGKEGWIRSSKLKSLEQFNAEKAQEEAEKKAQEEANKAKQVEQANKVMYVNAQSINVRAKADQTSDVIKQLPLNSKVTVISSDSKGWSYVDIDGTKGYIATRLLSSTKKETSRSEMTERESTKKTTTELNTSSKTGNSVVSYAQQFLGCKYVRGGTSTKGFDCSGFTQFVYKNFGISLNRTAAAQYSNGIAVTNLQAGDLVMFGKSGINHVGIYIGGNKFIHAENPSSGVTTSSLSSSYYKNNYVGARRIIN